MSKLQKINSTHYRIVCDCGEFIHEITKGEKGIELESFMVSRSFEDEPEAKPKKGKSEEREERQEAPVKKLKEREVSLFFDEDEDEPEDKRNEDD